MAKKAYTESAKACWQEYRTPVSGWRQTDLLAVRKTVLQLWSLEEDVAAAVVERSISPPPSTQAPLRVTHLLGCTMPPPRYMPNDITGSLTVGGDKRSVRPDMGMINFVETGARVNLSGGAQR